MINFVKIYRLILYIYFILSCPKNFHKKNCWFRLRGYRLPVRAFYFINFIIYVTFIIFGLIELSFINVKAKYGFLVTISLNKFFLADNTWQPSMLSFDISFDIIYFPLVLDESVTGDIWGGAKKGKITLAYSIICFAFSSLSMISRAFLHKVRCIYVE